MTMATRPAKRRRVASPAGNGFHEESSSSSDGEDTRQSQHNGAANGERRRRPATNGNANLSSAFLGEIYKSNMFKIQVDELLEQIKPKHSDVDNDIAAQLRRIKDVIEACPDGEPVTVRLQ
jgi:U3 small nucleolar RNA-associated protein 22